MTHSFELKSIVDVVVSTSPPSAPRSDFNQMLIIGTKGLIPTSERLRLYENIDDMITDGFLNTDPEYLAAQLYFGQNPSPTQLWVGRQDISTSPPESCVDAVTACRIKNAEWYVCLVCGAVKQDHEDIAAYIEDATPSSIYAYTTQDADVLTGATSPANIFQSLNSQSYERTIGQYSTDNLYAMVAEMGYAMGQNSGLANSAFTLKFKGEVGINPENVTATQRNYIEQYNGNLYLLYGNFYKIFEQGTMADGSFFDRIINLDMLVNNIQLSVMDLLYQNPKVPQTDAGVTQIIHSINQACELALSVGYLGAGQWRGSNILNLKQNDMLPKGYLVQAATLSSQSNADKEARKSPPLYVAINEAGAIHSVLIGVYVNA